MTNVINRALVAKKNVINRALAAKKKLILLFAAILMASTTLLAEAREDAANEVENVATAAIAEIQGASPAEIQDASTAEIITQIQNTAISGINNAKNAAIWEIQTTTDNYSIVKVWAINEINSIKANALENIKSIISTVSYLYPVYNTADNPSSGIKEWKTTTVDAIVVTNSTTTLSAGWYVVNGTDVQTGGLTCSGAVNLILADDAKLTATGDEVQSGIQVSGTGNSLTIYGQTAQSGQLIAEGNAGAGIGGNGETNDGSNITINGGIVKASSLRGGAGIGGGSYGSGSYITINGGTVTAIGYETSGIGGGQNGSGSNIFVNTDLVVKTVASDNTTTVVENTGSDLASSLDGKQYVVIEPALYASYIDADGVEKIAKNVTEITDYFDNQLGTTGKTTWYVVTGTDVKSKHGANCNGDVRLILADGAKLTATGNNYAGIQVSGEGNSLTIYGQINQTGELVATGDIGTAGIGGGIEGTGSNITINGGKVTATGGPHAAGIGGGNGGSGSNITINNGNVTANGGDQAAGIGGGNFGSGSNITINGGTVTANGDDAAGIVGGYKDSGSYITITGGIITANGGEDAAGIGGGAFGNGYNITITGGKITATGGKRAAGIGGGNEGTGSNIAITGGTVTANGGVATAGIGGGLYSSGSNITINVTYKIKADENNPPVTLIHNDGTDLASSLAQKRYVSVYPDPYLNERTAAMAAINAAIEGIAEEHILAAAATAKENVFIADKAKDIDAAKEKALADLQILIAIYNSGKAAGLGSLATPCDGCPAIEVTDEEENTITLYNPKQVKFKKTETTAED